LARLLVGARDGHQPPKSCVAKDKDKDLDKDDYFSTELNLGGGTVHTGEALSRGGMT
jgi:hypothetical protein